MAISSKVGWDGGLGASAIAGKGTSGATVPGAKVMGHQQALPNHSGAWDGDMSGLLGGRGAQ